MCFHVVVMIFFGNLVIIIPFDGHGTNVDDVKSICKTHTHAHSSCPVKFHFIYNS